MKLNSIILFARYLLCEEEFLVINNSYWAPHLCPVAVVLCGHGGAVEVNRMYSGYWIGPGLEHTAGRWQDLSGSNER